MDRTDERIIELLRRDGRMSFKALGDALGMSRPAAKKRVRKLEEAGIIRGYAARVRREGEITVLIDIVTVPGRCEAVLDYLNTETAYVRQIYRTTLENHIHAVAVSDSVRNLKYLTEMIQKTCGSDIAEMSCHAVKEVIKDVYGGIRSEQRSESDESRET